MGEREILVRSRSVRYAAQTGIQARLQQPRPVDVFAVLAGSDAELEFILSLALECRGKIFPERRTSAKRQAKQQRCGLPVVGHRAPINGGTCALR